jgi:hypothetical protein
VAHTYQGVACPTSRTCVAVGLDDLFDGKSAVVTTANGAVRAWPGSLALDAMHTVACPGTSTCLAVSSGAVATVNASTGAMKVTEKLKPPSGGIVALTDVACASSTSCYAVGFKGAGPSSRAIVVHLSAAGKQLGLDPGVGTAISAIACPSATLCIVSAHLHSGREVTELIAGGILAAGYNFPAATFVERLACYQAKVCYALGGKSTSGIHLANELFPISASAGPRSGAVGKAVKIAGFSGTGMACVSATKCLIVGFTGVGPRARAAVVTVSHGRPGKPARLGPAKAVLANVACASATVCYAVGNLSGKAFVIRA